MTQSGLPDCVNTVQLHPTQSSPTALLVGICCGQRHFDIDTLESVQSNISSRNMSHFTGGHSFEDSSDSGSDEEYNNSNIRNDIEYGGDVTKNSVVQFWRANISNYADISIGTTTMDDEKAAILMS